MKKLRIGVVGAGKIAETGHLPFYQKHPDVELAAIADRNTDRAKAAASMFGVKQIYQDMGEMLKNERLDAVSICTPNASHIPLALSAIEAGVDVLIEKPIGTCSRDARKLVEKAAEQNRICMVGMTHRFRNDVRAIKRFIDTGEVGQPYYAKAKILRRRGTPTGWFTDLEKSGGGPLMDIGVHALDLAWWLMGKPNPISASGHLVKGIGKFQTDMLSRWQSVELENTNNDTFDVEDFAAAFIRFENGAVINLEVSWAINGHQDDGIQIDIFGTTGGVSLDPPAFFSERNQLFLESRIDLEPNNAMEEEINHFIESVQTRKPPLITGEDGYKVLEILNGIAQSSEQGKELPISFSCLVSHDS